MGEVGDRTVTGELSVFMGTTPLEARDSYLQNERRQTVRMRVRQIQEFYLESSCNGCVQRSHGGQRLSSW